MGKKCDETYLLADYINKILDMKNALTGRSFFLLVLFVTTRHVLFKRTRLYNRGIFW